MMEHILDSSPLVDKDRSLHSRVSSIDFRHSQVAWLPCVLNVELPEVVELIAQD